MKSVMMLRNWRSSEFAAAFRVYCRKYCNTQNHTKTVHPYYRIHPWKSENEFVKSLLNNVIYNADGIIAINKPYGIPVNNSKSKMDHIQLAHKIPNAMDYTLVDVLPYLAKKLDVPILIPCSGAEKYMSGVYVFGINDNICENIKLAISRTQGKSKKYWVVTIRVPNEIKGNYHLGMVLQKSELGNKKAVIVPKWSKNAVERGEAKIINIDFKVLSNSTHNLSSLIEIQSSTRKWNGIRLFASTMLYSPILGDNIYGSRVQEIMGTWLKVNPFADSCWDMPKINKKLLDLLNITPSQQEIIPTHIHLRSLHLIFRKNKDVIIEAPLMDPFDWTCKQLLFKIPDEEKNIVTDNEEQLIQV